MWLWGVYVSVVILGIYFSQASLIDQALRSRLADPHVVSKLRMAMQIADLVFILAVCIISCILFY